MASLAIVESQETCQKVEGETVTVRYSYQGHHIAKGKRFNIVCDLKQSRKVDGRLICNVLKNKTPINAKMWLVSTRPPVKASAAHQKPMVARATRACANRAAKSNAPPQNTWGRLCHHPCSVSLSSGMPMRINAAMTGKPAGHINDLIILGRMRRTYTDSNYMNLRVV